MEYVYLFSNVSQITQKTIRNFGLLFRGRVLELRVGVRLLSIRGISNGPRQNRHKKSTRYAKMY